MNWTRLSSSFFFLTIVGSSAAQQESRHSIGVSIGGSAFGMRDEHASPMIYNGIGIAPTFEYSYNGDNDRHVLEGSYDYVSLNTTADNFHGENRRARIRYSYLRCASDRELFNNRLTLFLGGSIGSYLSHTDFYFQYLPMNGIGHGNESWYWSNSIDFAALLEYHPAVREAISLRLSLPVVSSVARPTYSPSGNFNYVDGDWKFSPPWPWKSGMIQFFTDAFAVDAMLTYRRAVAGIFDLELRYEFTFTGIDQPQQARMYENALLAGILVRF